ncbi:MAG: hypothetical protein WKF40_08115 [Thermoleophilaceae bacterium]
MTFGCIDIGSNTTRLLVAEVDDGRLREVLSRRVFTRIGASVSASGEIPPEKVAETAETTDGAGGRGTRAWRLADRDRGHGRGPPGPQPGGAGAGPCARRPACGCVCSAERRRPSCPLPGHATPWSTCAAGWRWSTWEAARPRSPWARRTGQAGVVRVAARWGRACCASATCSSDPPPTRGDRRRLLPRSTSCWRTWIRRPRTPPWRWVGRPPRSPGWWASRLTQDSLRAGLARLCTLSAQETARELGLPLERARLLPAGIAVLAGIAAWLECALQIVRGGVREGTVLEMAGGGA